MFKTLTANPNGETTKCLVYPLKLKGNDRVGIIYPRDVFYETHVVLNPSSGKEEEARMEVEVKVNGKECRVDPFEFGWSSGMFALTFALSWVESDMACLANR